MSTLTLSRPAPAATEPERRRPVWVRPAVLVLLLGTALLYLWGLSASGNANSFYAAAVQAGTKSWKAFFFGSLDSANAITVDKPPAALWVMELSGRIFGFNSWSMLAPQALEGVAAVGLLYLTVRRWFGPVAGLLAGTILALTPVAVLMFRFNNPDALLTLVLVAAGYAVTRAVEAGRLRWMVLVGALVGVGFLTKMLQAFLIVPALGLVFLVAAPVSWRKRILGLAVGLAAMIAAAGWWVLTVELWPAGSRPYIGGSTNNSVLGLAFGYNGLGRLAGGEGNGGGGGGGMGGGNTSFGGAAGLTRLFGTSFGDGIAWLLPAALIALVAGLWLTRRAPRTDRTRAALIFWGGWLLVTAIVFSYMQGTIHPYYAVVLAPPIGALVAIVGTELWRRRTESVARPLLAVLVAVTAVWDYVLLARNASWHPWIRYAVLVLGALAVAGLLLRSRTLAKVAVGTVVVATVSGLLGTAAYAGATASVSHNGSIPTVGSTNTGGFGGGPGGRGGGAGGGFGGPGGGAPGSSSTSSGSATSGTSGSSGSSGSAASGQGGPGGEDSVNSALAALIAGTNTRWAAATIGSQGAASLELSTGKAVMAIGGFTGSDPSPTLAQFQAYVAQGKIRYFIASSMGGGAASSATSSGSTSSGSTSSGSTSSGNLGGGPGGGMGGPGGSTGTGSAISTWVAAHFTATTAGGQTVYDLSKQIS